MDFMDILISAGGSESLTHLAKHYSLSLETTTDIVFAASPYFIQALHARTNSADGKQHLRKLIESGGPQQFVDRPQLVVADVAQIEGRGLLGSLFEDSAAIDEVKRGVATQSNVDHGTIDTLLAPLAGLFFGAICKKVSLQTARAASA